MNMEPAFCHILLTLQSFAQDLIKLYIVAYITKQFSSGITIKFRESTYKIISIYAKNFLHRHDEI